MKTFTKIFLASMMAVVCISGHGAHLKAIVNNEGAFIPKAPAEAVSQAAHLVNKGNYSFASLMTRQSNDWYSLKSFSKHLSLPKRTYNNFSANSSNEPLPEASMLHATYKFDEGRLKPSLNAYPNPSKGKFTISLSQTSGATYKITLANTIGHVIKVIEVHPGYHSYVIDLSDKPAGVYFYSLSVNDKLVETKRLILQQ